MGVKNSQPLNDIEELIALHMFSGHILGLIRVDTRNPNQIGVKQPIRMTASYATSVTCSCPIEPSLPSGWAGIVTTHTQPGTPGR